LIKELICNNKIVVIRCNPLDRYYVTDQIIATISSSADQWHLCDTPPTTEPIESLSQPLLSGYLTSSEHILLHDWITAAAALPDFSQSYLFDLLSLHHQRSDSKLIFLETSLVPLPKIFTNLSKEYEWPLPAQDEIRGLLSSYSVEASDRTVAVCRGLCYEDLKEGLRQSITSKNPIEFLSNYRDDRFTQQGISLAPKPEFARIAGLDLLQAELKNVIFRFSSIAQELGLPTPKGWLLIGPPGVGKTWTAMVTGAILGFPVLSLNADTVVMNGMAGIKKILSIAEALAPCVFLVDETEKCFGSALNRQIFGYMLQFMNDNKKPIFFFGTVNRPDELPIEIVRRGRLDKTWYVGFPDELDRQEAFKLFLEKYDDRFLDNGDPFTLQEWSTLVNATRNFAPAEIKGVVEEAICILKQKDRDANITAHELATVARSTYTMFKFDEERMLVLDRAAKGKAMPAQSPDRKLSTYQKYDPHAPLPPLLEKVIH
jgi:ATP-dependent 26S proteasome regulatory subunit